MIAAIAAFLAPLRGPLMWLALAVALTFGSLLYGFVKGEAHVQAKWDAARIAAETKATKDRADQLKREMSLQRLADTRLEEGKREADRIRNKYDAALDGLRQRPEGRADTGTPEAPSASVGCTGKGLARPDAEFLAGYAADAARLQSALSECRAAYRAAAG